MNDYSSDSHVDTNTRESIISEAKIGIARCNPIIEDANNRQSMLKQLLEMSDEFLSPNNLNRLRLIEEIKLNCAQQISEEFNAIFNLGVIGDCQHNIEQLIENNSSYLNLWLTDLERYKKDYDFYSNQLDII